MRDLVADGGNILFVGTKKQAQDPVRSYAEKCGMPYVNERWLGGMLTNFQTMSKSVTKLDEIQASKMVTDSRDRLAVTWVGLDDNRPAGVTGSNAAMRVWARLFRQLPIEPVDLRMPDGANFVWVDKQKQALTDPSCPGAAQIPFIEGTEPRDSTKCLKKLRRESNKSLWRKWFEGKN